MGRILAQEAGHKVYQLGTVVGWEGCEGSLDDAINNCKQVAGNKGMAECSQFIEDTTQCPHVRFLAVRVRAIIQSITT